MKDFDVQLSGLPTLAYLSEGHMSWVLAVDCLWLNHRSHSTTGNLRLLSQHPLT